MCTKHLKTGWIIPPIFREAVEINYNLFFSFDTFKIFTSLFPLYVGCKMIDNDVQSCFYESRCHKNCCQLPSWCEYAATLGIGISIVALGSFAFLGKTDEVRTISRVFLVGMPFVIFGKDLIKKWKCSHCKRPRNSKFSRFKDYYGGFPSGHMAESIYMTVFFGLHYGAKAYIPLSVLSLFVAAESINCNRHYLSQVVAGAGLGAAFAVAAHKVVKREFNEKKISLDFDCDQRGNPALSLSCCF